MNTSVTDKTPRISIIGAGNVATHLAVALHDHADIVQIYTPHLLSASRLAQKTGATAIDAIADMDTSVDYIILSIKDDAVADVLHEIESTFEQDKCIADIIWMHTAGSVGMSCFPKSMPRHGILYPLQTFSRDIDVNVHEVPFFVEASNSDTLNKITEIAQMLSHSVTPLDSESRRQLHAAAVLACNMPMYLWSLAHDVLQAHNLDFEVMRPLLQVTLDKTSRCTPLEGMTGPARRGDTDTIRKHLDDLPQEAAEVYAYLSEMILKKFHPDMTILPHEQN